ncbi:N-terminal acetyltransferase [Orbilia oligospora]|uniref:N-terminal acetyltransferase n=1 Tax=Orbilia oligospora TaxID=2813651 RepID=A0A7C8RKG8_ORBOL|nr:N-terminal acetyltransferase [Orbilia oligospora]KAF3313384.1 N-terminal acetyltransferase [Orbilia oligospora]
MASIRPFTAVDLFSFNPTNLDVLTENYDISFYLSYLSRWPKLFLAVVSPTGTIMAYIMGKAEGEGKEWHGHVTALTVAPAYRRLGLAKVLMEELERVSEEVYDGYFVDLYVRVSNELAVNMYKKMGYSVYRRVVGYYSAGGGAEAEDAYDMRKPMKRDVKKESIREKGEEFLVSPEDVY